MSMINASLCMACMSRNEGKSICPQCGYDNNTPHNPEYLKPGTVIGSRYIVGVLTRKNGESATYIGWDTSIQCKVSIAEYFSTTLAKRDRETGVVMPLADGGAQYKALMADYLDMCNDVRRLSISDPVVPIDNVVSENNTLYAIYKDLPVVTYQEYLERQGGTIPFDRAKKLLLPLLNAVSNIHGRGIIHRGISPANIVIDIRDKLYLTGFALGATRTAGSELEAELYNGFSAPEQYAANGWQGTWTDVYALAALIYYSVSGVVPPKSVSIGPNRPLTPISQLVPGISTEAEQAIADAMNIDPQERLQTVPVFLSKLISAPGISPTIPYDAALAKREVVAARNSRPVETQRQASEQGQQKEGKYTRMKPVVITLACTVVVLAVVLLVISPLFLGDLFSVQATNGNSPSPSNVSEEQGEEESQEEEIGVIPDFFSMNADDVKNNPDYNGIFEFEIQEKHDEAIAEGIIMDQNPTSGTPLQSQQKMTIQLDVSKGPLVLKMPDLSGKDKEEALKIIQELGEEYKLDPPLTFESFDVYKAGAKEGEFVRSSPAAGEEFRPAKDTIQVYFAIAQDVSQSFQVSSSSKSDSPVDQNPPVYSSSSSYSSSSRRGDNELDGDPHWRN